MDALTFISNLASAAAWPASAVILALLFRKQLRSLIERVNTVKGPGGLELGLGHSLEKGQESSEQVALERAETSRDTVPPVLSPTDQALARDFPGAAFEKFYKEAETRLLQLRSQIPDNKPHRNLNEVMKWLRDHGHVSESTGKLWLAIREARNQALHVARDEGITGYDAVTFGTQVKQLIEALQGVKFAQ